MPDSREKTGTNLMPTNNKEKVTAYNVWRDPSAPDQDFNHGGLHETP
jgi:hypothetical protein